MAKVFQKITSLFFVMCLFFSSVQPIGWQDVAMSALGALALLNPVAWCAKRCKRQCAPARDRADTCIRGYIPCATCLAPEDVDVDEEIEEEITLRMVASGAVRWGVRTVHLLIPVAMLAQSHMIFGQEVSTAQMAAFTLFLSQILGKRVKKWERQGSSQSSVNVVVENCAIGAVSAVLVKLETELFFIILPSSWVGAVLIFLGGIITARPILEYTGKLADNATSALRSFCSHKLQVIREWWQSGCRCRRHAATQEYGEIELPPWRGSGGAAAFYTELEVENPEEYA